MTKINFNQVLLIAFVMALASSMSIQNSEKRMLFIPYCDYTLNVYPSPVVVKIVREHEPVPHGYRLMTLHEGYRYWHQLKQYLGEWELIKFDYGRIVGWGYGSVIEPNDNHAGWKFVIRCW